MARRGASARKALNGFIRHYIEGATDQRKASRYVAAVVHEEVRDALEAAADRGVRAIHGLREGDTSRDLKDMVRAAILSRPRLKRRAAK